MKKFILMVAVVMLSFFAFQTVKAQDGGTFIEVTESKDSSHINGVLDFSDDLVEEESGSSNGIWIGLGAVVVAGGAFFFLKKKK